MARITVGTGIWIDYTVSTVSQNIGANVSVIRLNAKVVTNGSGWMNYSWTTSQIARVYIDGRKVDGWDVGTQIGPNTTRDLGTRQYAINHNANGTKAITVKFEYQINANVSGGYRGTVSGSTPYTIKTIPRASSVSVQGLNLPSKTIKITTNSPAGGSAQNKLSIYINNAWQADVIKWGSGTATWNMSDNKIRELIKTLGFGATYAIKVVCNTIISGQTIGSATATSTVKNIVKPTLTAGKAKYDILNDTAIKLTLGSTAAGISYTTTTTSPTLGTISLNQAINNATIKKLIEKYETLPKINESVTCKVDIKYGGQTCRTETFTPCSYYASTEDFIDSVTPAVVSFNAESSTTSWYQISLGVVELNKVSDIVKNQLKIMISVDDAYTQIIDDYIANSAPVVINATRMQLQKISELDDQSNSFRFTVNTRVTFELYGLLVFESSSILNVLKREIYEITPESENTLASIGTKVFTSKWTSYSEYLNNLFFSKSPVPQFFYIPVLDKIPEWVLENELGEELKSPLPTKQLFDKVVKNGIDDPYTLSMMYLLCIYEGSRDTSYYKPNENIKAEIDAKVVISEDLLLDSSGYPNLDYEGTTDVTITKLYYHATSGVPTFELSNGKLLAAKIGNFKFKGIDEIIIVPINLEEYYDPSPAPNPQQPFTGIKKGDFIQPTAYYRKETNGSYTQIKDSTMFYVIDVSSSETYQLTMYKLGVTDKTVYYGKLSEVPSSNVLASSVHSLDWYTDGKSDMAIRSPISETFTVRGYSGGVATIRSGDIIYIDESASGSYKFSGDLNGITKRFYECLYPVQLSTKYGYSKVAYWVEIQNSFKLILEQDVVGTKGYYDRLFGSKYPPKTSIYSAVKMTAPTPPEYYTWKTSNIVTSIVENDIQGGIYQSTVGQYSPPATMEFKQYVENEEVCEQVIELSPQDLLVYLKTELPESDLNIRVVQEDLFNKSVVSLIKKSPNPYLFMDTELNSVGLLQYPTKQNSVEFPK